MIRSLNESTESESIVDGIQNAFRALDRVRINNPFTRVLRDIQETLLVFRNEGAYYEDGDLIASVPLEYGRSVYSEVRDFIEDCLGTNIRVSGSERGIEVIQGKKYIYDMAKVLMAKGVSVVEQTVADFFIESIRVVEIEESQDQKNSNAIVCFDLRRGVSVINNRFPYSN